jgi:isoleucyl-tRNA synthetase
LSAFYFNIRKDVLYCDPTDSIKRKSAIKFLNIILEILLRWFAPILSFTSEEIYSLIKTDTNKSIHLEKFSDIPSKWHNNNLSNKWIELIKIREICNSSIELKRASKEIGSSLEANLTINLSDKLIELTKGIDFSELCITSGAIIEKMTNNKKNQPKTVIVETIKAEGQKCPICWKININQCERHS